jgi:hypothetical protein
MSDREYFKIIFEATERALDEGVDSKSVCQSLIVTLVSALIDPETFTPIQIRSNEIWAIDALRYTINEAIKHKPPSINPMRRPGNDH